MKILKWFGICLISLIVICGLISIYIYFNPPKPYFPVTTKVPYSFNITSPKNGEVLYVGDTARIIWTSENLPEDAPVHFRLRDHGHLVDGHLIGRYYDLEPTTNTGTFSWVVTDQMMSNIIKIEIENYVWASFNEVCISIVTQNLVGTSWILKSIKNIDTTTSIATDGNITLDFYNADHYTGSYGNLGSYYGYYYVDGNNLNIVPTYARLTIISDDPLQGENYFFKLQQAHDFKICGDELIINGINGSILLFNRIINSE